MYIYLLSAIFPPGGTNPEKAFRPLDRLSTRWHFGGTQTVKSDLRTISMPYQKWKAQGPWRRNEVALLAPANHQSGRCEDARRTRHRRRCARRLLRLISHFKHAVESLTTLPQRPMHTRRLETSQPLVTANHQAVAAQMRGGQVGGVASGGPLHGGGVAILFRLPASVMLGSHQNRRPRNRAQGIQNLKTLW